MAEKSWSPSVVEGWESKSVAKDNDSSTVIHREAGQQTEYPHSTTFTDSDGNSSGHNSNSKSEHDTNVVSNPAFYVQNDNLSRDDD